MSKRGNVARTIAGTLFLLAIAAALWFVWLLWTLVGLNATQSIGATILFIILIFFTRHG